MPKEAPAPTAPEALTKLGSFSNMTFTVEHQYGFAVGLWRKKDGSVIGLLDHSNGLIGDTPTGRLAEANYDPATGAISFEALLQMGTHGCKRHDNVPSRDLYRFKGTLQASKLVGKIESINVLDDNQLVETADVELARTEGDGAGKDEDLAAWEASTAAILQARGPR